MTVSQADKSRAFVALHEHQHIRHPKSLGRGIGADAGVPRLRGAGDVERRAGCGTRPARRTRQPCRSQVEVTARLIVDATDLPVSADLEKGFGDRPDAAQTIREAGAIGLVGGSIEDATGDPARPIYDLARPRPGSRPRLLPHARTPSSSP